MSRRIATDQGGKRGPQSSRGVNHGSNRNDDRFRDDDRTTAHQTDRPGSSSNNNATNGATIPPPIPGFGMNFPTLPNGIPMFPTPFPFPFPQMQQNPKLE
jgi:protein NRD1